MKKAKKYLIEELKILIDFSCDTKSQLELFELFHKMLIRMAYKAVDVNIDYERKRVFMNVLAEDESYDAVLVNEFAEKMAVNLGYTDLNTFLRSCVLEDIESIKQYYPFLVSSFYKRTEKTLQIFETA